MTTRGIVAWHGLHPGEAVRLLDTDVESGLSESEANVRLAKFGPNVVTRRRGTPKWKRFLLQFYAPLVYILLAAAGITAWLGEWIDSSVIFGVVFVNAVIGYLQDLHLLVSRFPSTNIRMLWHWTPFWPTGATSLLPAH